MKHIDYYRILQVHHDAGQEVIEAAYRRLSRMHHPDVNRSPFALEKMKTINNAYEILGDIERRRAYHIEWLERVPLVSRYRAERMNPSAKDQAEDIVEAYFGDLLNEEWESAYYKLTFSDRSRIPLTDFIEWRQAVSLVFRIGSFRLKYFSGYKDCDYAGEVYSEIRHYSVTVSEMNIESGTVSEETTQKYVAYDHGSWKICLGYSDLSPVILKFRQIAESKAENKAEKIEDEAYSEAGILMDADTRVLSRKGFLALAEHEIMRSKRYEGPLTMITVGMADANQKKHDSDHETARETARETDQDLFMMAVIHTIETIRCNTRETDLVGRWNKTRLAIILTETALESAAVVFDKLLALIQTCAQGRFDLYAGISKLNEKLEDVALFDLIEEAFSAAPKRIIKESKAETEADPKIGKYNLNDILGFNRPKMPRV